MKLDGETIILMPENKLFLPIIGLYQNNFEIVFKFKFNNYNIKKIIDIVKLNKSYNDPYILIAAGDGFRE